MTKRNLILILLCGGLYLFNRVCLVSIIPGILGRFLVCYFNDLLAGIVLPAVTALLLLAAHRSPLRKWSHIALLLLSAGLVWECLAPLWKPGAVFDWWDFIAYQLGGLLYFLIYSCTCRRKNTDN